MKCSGVSRLVCFCMVAGWVFLHAETTSAAFTYVTTGTGNVVKVDIDTGSMELIVSLPSGVSPDVRGIAYDEQDRIYIGTTWLSDSPWAKRVIRITPQMGQPAIVEPFTPIVPSTSGVGQIGFNTRGELFVTGTGIYRYNETGQLIETVVSSGGPALLMDGDELYSIEYFPPIKLVRYDTSGAQAVGGVIAQVQFPYDYCPTSLSMSHTGNLAIGFSSVNHAGWTELWEYNFQTQDVRMLFDCGGPSGFSQYDPFSNTYLVGGGTGLRVLDTEGNLVKTVSGPDLQSVRLISKTFIPEPCALSVLALGCLALLRRRRG